jgi:hypothetical protein
MKRNIILASLLLVVLFAGTSCKKDHNPPVITNTPATPPPSGFETGTYANGFQNMIDLIDVYTGKVVGAGWTSGAAIEFTADGKNAEFYYTAETQYMQAATKAVGTIAFDEGSTADEGSFTYYANSGHYKGYGSTTVDRDATKDELTNQLTTKYYYKMEGQWLRIEPNGPVNEYSKSFELIQ